MSEHQPQQNQQNPSANPGPQTFVRGPERGKPVLVWVILGVTVMFYIAQEVAKKVIGFDFPFVLLGKFNEEILKGQLWRLFTPVLLHGGLLHLFANMYALVMLGRSNETIQGHLRFFLLYILAAFGGNVFSFVLGKYPSLGASTAAFGLLAAEAVFIWQNKLFFGKQARNHLLNIGLILLLNLGIGLSAGGTIDNWGHLGGLIGGFFFAFLAGVKWDIVMVNGTPTIVDKREKRDIVLATLLVFAAFAAIAAIPFLK